MRTVAPAASVVPSAARRSPRLSMTSTVPFVSLIVQLPFWASAGAPLSSSESNSNIRRETWRMPFSLGVALEPKYSSDVEMNGKRRISMSFS